MEMWSVNWPIDIKGLRIADTALPLLAVVLITIHFLSPYLRGAHSRNAVPNAKGQAVLNKHRKFGGEGNRTYSQSQASEDSCRMDPD